MSSFDDDHNHDRSPRPQRGMSALAVLGAIALAVALVFVLAIGTLVGLRGGGSEESGNADSSPPRRAATTSTTTAPTSNTAARPASAVLDHAVHVKAGRATLLPPPVLDELEDAEVLDVTASGFLANATGAVVICEVGVGHGLRCGQGFPVRTDDSGRARFQYRVERRGACDRVGGCLLVVDVDDVRASARLVFGHRAPAPAGVTVTPSAGPAADDTVEVAVVNAEAGGKVVVMQCPADATETTACEPADGGAVTVGAGGTAVAMVTLASSARQLVVVDGDGVAVAPAVALQRRPGPAVDYDAARAIGGLLLAAVLATLAALLVRSTDWRAPAEAATPELDRASLSEG